ncbi:MAG TPA: PD-(D/E)XK nuclease family protein [Acidobacteriaceae bacterium]|nr:PD-(D/E)XK nuclease family protein [Acidobacteriaceae bacterium]
MPVPVEIDQAFASGATIVAASARASRWLHREYALQQRRAERRAWTTPPITDWETWLRQRWQAHVLEEADPPLLLTSLQERSIWTRVQREDAGRVVSPESIAALAESAYSLLSSYNAQGERNRVWIKSDSERFRQWAVNFDWECARRSWVPRAGLEQRLASTISATNLPREMVLVGFHRITPAQDTLLHAIKAHGVRIQFVEPELAPARTDYIRALDLQQEIMACARWTRGLIEQNPQARIGVLVPDLRPVRAEMERIFRRVLMPESNDIFFSGPMPFEFSLGQPLSQAPLICSALLLLRWLNAPLREEELSWLLLSGFLSTGDAERNALAKRDATNRNSGTLSPEISLQQFLNGTRGSGLTTLSHLAYTQKLAETNRIASEPRSPARWTDIAQVLLREAGWPGGVANGSYHFQAVRRWEHALDELALLEFDGRRIPYDEFLRALESHAREIIFSPESRGAPVQIMAALEASGQQFDALWFLGADDASWPLRGRFHPLLPNDVQHRHKMPYADPGHDLELARAVTTRITRSAKVLVFSYAQRNRDGELRPSPLLPSGSDWRDETSTTNDGNDLKLETVEEPSAQISWPKTVSPGGSEVLKDQAACPFRAFAVKRLRAETLNRREWGLSAAERGKLLHKVLERIWSPKDGALHTLDELRAAIRQDHLSEILRTAIANAFTKVDSTAGDDPWMRAYLESEKQRLHLRLTAWMKLEADRASFEVAECEKDLSDVDVGGLKLKLRADRIDHVEGSGSLLIDYKSGNVSPKDWDLPRPNEPQLPLYAVFGNVENVRGALFARIRAGKKMGFTGAVEDVRSQLLPNESPRSELVKNPFTTTMRDEWHDALLKLADAFLRGEALIDPKHGADTCRYCPLPGLCRVAETQSIAKDEDEADDDNTW